MSENLSAAPSISVARLMAGLRDVRNGAREWRSWWVLAFNDVHQRYRRSRIGPFWLTFSLGLTIAGIGVVFPILLNQSVSTYVAFIAAGMIAWAMLSTTIEELTTSVISSEVYLRSYPGPRSTVIFRVLARNLLMSAHNLILLIPIWLFFDTPINSNTPLFIIGLLLFLANATWIGLILGPLSARFRDVPLLVHSLIQLLFFLTPVLYKPEQLSQQLKVLTHYNPFANLLELLRAPLLGLAPELHHYAMACLLLMFGYGVAIPFYARFRERIVYWL